MDKDEVLKLALSALFSYEDDYVDDGEGGITSSFCYDKDAVNKAITAIRQALAAPVQEPFGYFKAEPFGWTDCAETDEGAMALYEHPAAQPAPVQEREAFLAGYEAAQADAKVCHLPPHGWRCTRTANHDGPCAAVESPEDIELVASAMKRLREATPPAQPAPVQQSLACKTLCDLCVKRGYDFCANAAKTTPIPTPAAQPAVPLTDGQIEALACKHLDVGDGPGATHFVTGEIEFARAVEAAHGIKENT